ncbi:MAG: ABC transporter ATP-binding protein [Candidatus Heimdallarchaeota archaeon]|nr:ABC transporter ATP-binding protein [Candidatus Heimdallarchaeota archaeon]
MSDAIIKIDKVTKIYRRGRSEVVRALDKVSLEINAGEILMVIGPSGSGKTTLLNVLSGLDKPTDGKILFNTSRAGEGFKYNAKEDKTTDVSKKSKDKHMIDITEWDEKQLTQYRRHNVGFVFQAWELIPTLKAVENVESSLYPSNIPTPEIREKAIKLIRKVGLIDKEYAYPDQLSGGEQQRVAICRALIKEPRIVFADEPTGNLDSESGNQIMRQMKLISRDGAAVLIATHNMELRKFADRIIKIHDGQISY